MPSGSIIRFLPITLAPFYNLIGGLQDNGTWVGPSQTREPAGILNDDWRMISFGDGFFAIAHPENPDLYSDRIAGRQRCSHRYEKPRTADSSCRISVSAARRKTIKYRFNWNAPLILSPHDKETVFFAGSNVFKSNDFGKTWTAISPDLTKNNRERLKDAGGPIFTENTSAEAFATIISLTESPLQKDVIWAGTDDGNLQMTTDGGKNWTNVVKNVPKVPEDSSVSHVELSRTNTNTAYVAFDRHKFDDYKPYIFKTEDGGKSFENITGNLPEKSYVHVVTRRPEKSESALRRNGTRFICFI